VQFDVITSRSPKTSNCPLSWLIERYFFVLTIGWD